ncbi:beta-L-arabinofuranosidase domain-containing protein [Niallia sp.]|uniref:glycoside hydrolase family 127 protein n=1 Tax=Niallia sp. TaxID=2837523 RepID=UPI0028A03E6A|nr:beta-L-arabinofuranosidase domain-containing protein [Niallia sp.]
MTLNTNINTNTIQIKDRFWGKYMEKVRTKMLPYQWGVLNDHLDITIEKERNDDYIPSEKSHAIDNFKIAAGLKEGNHYGWVFQDSDVYKWLEAVAYSLQKEEDQQLRDLADSVIDLLQLAQEKDGYLNTYFSIEEPERRFKMLAESHELYCAGHYIEAAVAYYEATHNEKALSIACKLADCIDANFGYEDGKIRGYDGHEEIELALTKLYECTKNDKYLQLSRFFLYERGQDTSFFARQRREDNGKREVIKGMAHRPLSYYQAHKPVLEQEKAEGHAVRLVYLCTGMAEVARLTKDREMQVACKRLWKNIVTKRMYITGGIGSTVDGEAFTADYDLPNDTMYCETCASIGLIFFAQAMLKNEPNSEYANVIERGLYNSVISGMALDGKHFFYVNPLEVVPEYSEKDPGKSHVKVTRPAWFGCACCPPNLARLINSLDKYIYTQHQDTIYVNLFMENESIFQVKDTSVNVQQHTDYPWSGLIRFIVEANTKSSFGLGIRIPNWSRRFEVKVNGSTLYNPPIKNGYLILEKEWDGKEEITLQLDMTVQEWSANPLVRENMGKIAIQRGPFIYCLEEEDNGNNLHLLQVSKNAKFTYDFVEEQCEGIGVIKTQGKKKSVQDFGEDTLYALYSKDQFEENELTFIPYFAWANRSIGEMLVWVRKES